MQRAAAIGVCDQDTIGIKIHHKPPDIRIFARSAGDCDWVAIGTGSEDRIAFAGNIATPQDICSIRKHGVAAGRDDHVNATEQWRKREFILVLLQMAEQHNLIDTLRRHLIQIGLQNSGEFRHVIHTTITIRIKHTGQAW